MIRLGLGLGLRWGDLCRLDAKDLRRDMSGWFVEVAVGKISADASRILSEKSI